MDYLRSTVDILCLGTTDSPKVVRGVLEDAESPATRKTIETLYKSTINKSHVNFGNIPKSKGDITKYEGYQSMIDTLANLKTLSADDSAYKGLLPNVNTVSNALANLTQNKSFYTQAFSKNIGIIEVEYNAFVYACVEATTSLLYQFADYMKTPSATLIRPITKNTKYRADLFFVEQLEIFNTLNSSGKYPKYLSEVIKQGANNFTGSIAFIVGAAAIASTVMLSIVPVTRKIIYTIQDGRNKLAECLELQAYFLEINAAYVKANSGKSSEKTKEILKKQENTRIKFLRLADKLRVKSLKSEEMQKKNLDEDNRTISLDSMRDEVNNDEISIL